MSDPGTQSRTKTQLLEEIQQLRFRLEEAEQTLEAIRHGEVDALVVIGPKGEQIYSLTGAEHIYRVIVETMNEAALMVDPDGTILFCNQRFCDLIRAPMERVMGQKVTTFTARPQQEPLQAFLADAQAEPLQRHLVLQAADGVAVSVQLSASLLEVSDYPSICLVATDLTELEESANSIRRLREHHEALQESESRFRTIFEASQDAIVITDTKNVVVQANPAVRTLFGLPPEQFIGRRLSEFFPEDDDFPAFWHTFQATGSFRGELTMIDADGQKRHVEASAVAEILPGRHLSVLRDITERALAQIAQQEANERLASQAEELEIQSEELQVQTDELLTANAALRESERRYRELVQNANSAIIRWRHDGTVTFFNEYAQAFFGYPEEEAVGRHISFLLPERDSTGADLTGLVRDIAAYPERYANHANENLCRDGRRVWMAWTNKPIRDPSGQVVEILTVGTDVTERRHAEEALQRLNATLESKVAERTAELEYRARQLQKLALELSETEDRERRQLAEILHDDLQQQLAAARFHLDLLHHRAKHDPAQQVIIDRVGQMLLEAIQKSRNLSHELSPVVLHHDDFGSALSWLAGQVRAKHGLEVVVDAFGTVKIESEAIKGFLYKAAQELVFNVIKHARVNRARIRVRRLSRCICLSVSDRGRGFDPQQVRQTAGFGLFSIRERVELLGGRMKMHSVPGHGSTFHVVVPDEPLPEDGYPEPAGAVSRARPRADETGPGGHGGPPLRVLLADDHQIVREGLSSLLSEAPDVKVVGEAANGREAINQAYRLRPDIVIMDVAMPLIDGDEATRQIKSHLPQTRVIALSMHEDADLVEKMRRAGAENYLLKTAPSEQLLAAIRAKPPAQAQT